MNPLLIGLIIVVAQVALYFIVVMAPLFNLWRQARLNGAKVSLLA